MPKEAKEFSWWHRRPMRAEEGNFCSRKRWRWWLKRQFCIHNSIIEERERKPSYIWRPTIRTNLWLQIVAFILFSFCFCFFFPSFFMYYLKKII